MTFLAVALAALALGLACAASLLRGAVSWRRAALAALGVLAVAVDRADWEVSPERITVLHEGGTRRALDAIFGRDEHVGRLWLDLAASPVARAFALPIEGLVQVNLVLATLSLAGLACVAWVATGRAVAAALTLLLVHQSSGFWNAAHSETPAPAVWFAFVTAAPAWKILDEARARPPTQHLLALASVVASAALAVGVREEFALHGGAMVALALGTFLVGGEAAESAFARVRDVGARFLRAPWPVRVGAVAASVLAVDWAERVHAPLRHRLAFAALVPSALPLQGVAAAQAVTALPALALALIGLVALARGGAARAVYALATLSLLSVHVVASHGVGWEMFRYGAHDVMALWLAAVAGWCALERHAAARDWHPSWRSSLAAGCAALALAPDRYEAAAPAWWDADARSQPPDMRRLAGQTRQREARVILRALRDEPACLFVGRARRWGEPRGAWELVTFGVGRPLTTVGDPAVTVRDLRATAGRCLRYVQTLDCNLRGERRCDDDLRGAVPRRVVRERLATYNDPAEYGEHAPEVSYGVWRVAP